MNMPVKYDLRWHPATRRWEKMVHGERIVVSVRQLKKLDYLPMTTPETKEATREAANRFLANHLASKTTPMDSLVQKLAASKEWLAAQGIETEFNPTLGIVLPKDFGGKEFFDAMSKRGVTVVKPPTIGANRDRFLAIPMARHKAGKLSAQRYDSIRYSLEKFVEWLGEESDASIISADRWEQWYLYVVSVSGKGCSDSYKKKWIESSRQFVQYLAEKGLIGLPSNFTSKQFKLDCADPAIKTFSVSEVKHILSLATGRLKLLIHLSLGAGLTQVDATELTPDQYQDGWIVRFRSKTGQKGSLVETPLWEETRGLIQEFGLPFTTKDGKAWVSRAMDKKYDGAAELWNVFAAKHGIGGSLKMFRATSASQLGNSKFSDLKYAWLGHRAPSVADRNYVGVFRSRMLEAVTWLAGQYGVK
jgi:integrase